MLDSGVCPLARMSLHSHDNIFGRNIRLAFGQRDSVAASPDEVGPNRRTPIRPASPRAPRRARKHAIVPSIASSDANLQITTDSR
jgi:hypothetical protein